MLDKTRGFFGAVACGLTNRHNYVAVLINNQAKYKCTRCGRIK